MINYIIHMPTKTTLSLTIDSAVVEILRNMNINISSEVNEFLKQRTNIYSTFDKNNIENLEKLRNETQNRLISIDNELKIIKKEKQYKLTEEQEKYLK